MKRAASSMRHLVREGEPELPPGMRAAPSSGAPNLVTWLAQRQYPNITVRRS
jgi:hypothetical protein